MISIYDDAELDALRSECAVQPHRMKLFKNAWFKRAETGERALQHLPAEAQPLFREQLRFCELQLHARQDSEIDGASKLVFKTQDGQLIESVILRHTTGRTSCCVSSQVGCACKCGFCATGEMGFLRDLTAAEILDQIQQANVLLQEEESRVRNVVFMGMGEPLLNPNNVYQALDALLDPARYDYPGGRIMVSTVGIPPAMRLFKQLYPQVNLALSLHCARQDVRERMMPLAQKYHLDELRTVLKELPGKVMVEYLMLAGLNDTAADLQALKTYLRGLSVHVNLIPFNAFEGNELTGTPPEEQEPFARKLKEAGFTVTLRSSLGNDIAAACGQLVKRQSKS